MNAATANQTVLIIDDDKDFCQILAEKLREGFTFIIANNLNDGIDKLSTEELDAILLDLTLPDSLPEKTVETVKRICPRVALIVVTGDKRSETKSKSIEDNAWGCLCKDEVLAHPKRAGREIHEAIDWNRRLRKTRGDDDHLK